jgi:hypothetical protein
MGGSYVTSIIDHKETVCEDADRIEQAQGRNHGRLL